MRLADLSESDRRSLEQLVHDFDHFWNDGRLKQVVGKLPPIGHPLRTTAIPELVRIDLKHQWALGRRARVEGYLHTFPELGTATTVVPELVLAEYEARQQAEGNADLADFEKRFPALIDRLRELILARPSVREQVVTLPPRPPETTPDAAPPTPPATPPTDLPSRFGPYEIVQKLGQGGMGAVYLARDTRLERQVALKVPRFTADDGPALLDRFYQEAKSAAALDHPNICKVYEAGCIDGTHYMTMAYVEGKPLSGMIKRGKPWDLRQAALLVRKLALVVHEAHQKGVVHRDLKPSNVMINQRKELVITDFGLARRLSTDGTRLSLDGAAMGTPAYMAPEQARGDLAAMGPSCDIYALGTLLYELLTGRRPFSGSPMEVIGQVLHLEPDRPSLHRPDLDRRLEVMCLKAMAKDPKLRYASAREFADDLRRWIDAVPSAVETTPEAIPEVLPARPSEVPTILPGKVTPPPPPKSSAPPSTVRPAAPVRPAPASASSVRAAPAPRAKPHAPPVTQRGGGWLKVLAVLLLLGLVGGGGAAGWYWYRGRISATDEAIIAEDVAECVRLLQIGQGSKEHIDKVGPGRIPIWRAAADRGSPEAQWLLSRCYQEGAGVEKAPEKAIPLLRAAADKGLAYAENNLGYCYSKGEGVGQNHQEALRWYQKAADKGLAIAMKNIGFSYLNGEGVPQNHVTAREWFQKAADGGDPSGSYQLGLIHFNGQGLDKPNQVEAVRWYRKAAEAGFSDAQDELGVCYANGWGVSKDAKEAAAWFRKAAEAGNAFGQDNYSYFLREGTGTDKNLEEAIRWSEKAVAQKVTHASSNRRFRWNLGLALHDQGKALLAKKEYEAATLAFRRAAEVQEKLVEEVPLHRMHRINLANTYTGLGDIRVAMKDYEAASKWYIKATDAGNPTAMKKLADLFETGQGVARSADEAKRLRDLAAKHNIKRFTIPCTVRGKAQKVPMHVYISDTFVGSHPLEQEERRLLEDHDATLPPEVKDAFQRLYNISRQNNVSFCDLSVYAMGKAAEEEGQKLEIVNVAGDDDKKKSPDKPAPSQPGPGTASKPADKPGSSTASKPSTKPATKPSGRKPPPTSGTPEEKTAAYYRGLGCTVTTDDKAPGKPVIGLVLTAKDELDTVEMILSLHERLPDLPNLRTLEFKLRPTITSDVSDDDLTGVWRHLKQLRTLSLEGTNVTDKTLKELEDLSSLQTLNVRKTKVTASGVEALKKKKSRLTVLR